MNEVTQSSRIIVMVSAFVTGFYSCPLLTNCVISAYLVAYAVRRKTACVGVNWQNTLLVLKPLTKTE